MTREEAIKYLELDKKDRGKCLISDAIDMAIEALEQKDILEDIRAEIEQTAKDYDKIDDYRDGRGFWLSLGIIDKYEAKSENK